MKFNQFNQWLHDLLINNPENIELRVFIRELSDTLIKPFDREKTYLALDIFLRKLVSFNAENLAQSIKYPEIQTPGMVWEQFQKLSTRTFFEESYKLDGNVLLTNLILHLPLDTNILSLQIFFNKIIQWNLDAEANNQLLVVDKQQLNELFSLANDKTKYILGRIFSAIGILSKSATANEEQAIYSCLQTAIGKFYNAFLDENERIESKHIPDENELRKISCSIYTAILKTAATQFRETDLPLADVLTQKAAIVASHAQNIRFNNKSVLTYFMVGIAETSLSNLKESENKSLELSEKVNVINNLYLIQTYIEECFRHDKWEVGGLGIFKGGVDLTIDNCTKRVPHHVAEIYQEIVKKKNEPKNDSDVKNIYNETYYKVCDIASIALTKYSLCRKKSTENFYQMILTNNMSSLTKTDDQSAVYFLRPSN